MPSVAVKLYSVFFKFLLKHRLQARIQNPDGEAGGENPFGVTSRPGEESVAPAKPTFSDDGIATKDIHIDPLTSLSVRIFLPDSSLLPSHDFDNAASTAANSRIAQRNSLAGTSSPSFPSPQFLTEQNRRISYAGDGNATNAGNGNLKRDLPGIYRGYSPTLENHGRTRRKLPVILQFHGGGFVSGSNVSLANDFFCRRIAKLLDAIVIAVGYRLAPESRYPAAFEDGLKVLNWLSKQANLAECSKSLGNTRGGGADVRRSSGGGADVRRSSGGDADVRRSDSHRHIADTFGASMVEPWLAAHGDPSRCVLLGVSCGANIADFVARKAVEAGKHLDPVKVVAQVLLYPFFIGSIPTHSEIKLANSYFYDKAMCILAWKLFLPEDEFSLDHPAANPLIPGRGPPLKRMPPTLTVVAEHDWMRDRAIAYSEELRKVNVDAPVLEYKDAVHEFATLDVLLKTPQAQACAEDIAIWVKKYISLRGHEFSY